MTFTFAPAVRERVSLIIAIAGASGGGKTLSALKVARGLAGGDDNRIAVIDTEAGRAKHYAVAPGERPGPDRFAFQHGDLRPPFTPEAYAEAIKAADDAQRFDVIMVDSCSHEYDGEGGITEMHDQNVAAAVEKARQRHQDRWGPFDEAFAAERANAGAWKDPKLRHKRLVSRLLQCRAHLILCLRAEEKLLIQQVEENGRKKTVYVQAKDRKPEERWTPICEKRFMYEMTLSLVVSPERPGYPIPIKLQAQHREAVPLDHQLSEETGRALAAWARGGAVVSPRPTLTHGAAEAADQPAPSMLPSESASSGAGEVPAYTPPEYIEQWDALLRDANTADDARVLHTRWQSEIEKTIRRKTFEPKETRLVALVTRVSNRIAELKTQVPA